MPKEDSKIGIKNTHTKQTSNSNEINVNLFSQ